MTRQIFVKEFGYDNLPDLLRDMADWLEQENSSKIWLLRFDSNDRDEEEGIEPITWAGCVFLFPPSL